MRTLGVMAVIGLGLIGAVGTASAQSWGPDYGYRDRDRDYGARDRDRGSRDNGAAAFNEREYLRCNPDVARAVLAGKMESGYKHFRVHGFREGRKLRC